MKTHFLIEKIPKKEGFVKLQDAYSFDPRNREVWDVNWRDTGTNSNLVVPKNYESGSAKDHIEISIDADDYYRIKDNK